jgi:hypothetical protein
VVVLTTPTTKPNINRFVIGKLGLAFSHFSSCLEGPESALTGERDAVHETQVNQHKRPLDASGPVCGTRDRRAAEGSVARLSHEHRESVRGAGQTRTDTSLARQRFWTLSVLLSQQRLSQSAASIRGRAS